MGGAGQSLPVEVVSRRGQGRGFVRVRVAQGGEVGEWRACAVTGLDLSVVDGGWRLLRARRLKSEIYKGIPYTRAVRGPRSKGMSQCQLTSPTKSEFTSKKCSKMFLDSFMADQPAAVHRPARFVHLTSRELAAQWWHRSWTS
jgi:hypothetical protein